MADQPANIRPNPVGDWPQIDASAFIDPSAQIIGKVTIGPRVFVGPCAVIRADEPNGSGLVQPIVIGEECNIQDGVIIHAAGGAGVTLDSRVSLAHGALVHGPANIGQDCFVGIRVVVINSTLEEAVWVGVGATILDITIPSFLFVPGRSMINSSDKVASLSPIKDSNAEFQRRQIAANIGLTEGYLRQR